MAPEVRSGCAAAAAGGGEEPEAPGYDQSADMFSLGVVFFEMWHPPFATAMERAHVLGRLAEGLGEQARLETVARMLPKGTPPEVAEILGSLLARQPRKRMAAEHLLNESGLLPAGAFDPQVQRLLKALENPSSTESVALLSALFDRSEETAKDVSFFDQLFRAARTAPEAETEARDSLQQLVRELCRKHGAVYELCPLLRPARRAPESSEGARAGAGSPSAAVLPQGRGPPLGCQLVDAGNTLLELRADLTEPIARAAAARAVAEEAAAGEDGRPLPRSRRLYHLGTIYRKALSSEAFAMEQSGHPREVSSAVAQFLWWRGEGGDGGEGSGEDRPAAAARRDHQLETAVAQAQECELLHLVAELFTAAGLGGPGGRAELQLADTRLLPLLLESAAQRALREPPPSRPPEWPAAHSSASPGERGGGGEAKVDRLRGRLAEALRLTLQQQQQQQQAAGADAGAVRRGRAASPSPLDRAAPGLEHAAAQLAGLLGGGSAAEGPRSAIHVLTELEEHFAATAAEGAVGGGEAAPAAEQLREVLRGLRGLARCVEGMLEVSLDVLQPVHRGTYGPGLAFRVLLRDGGVSPVVLIGGRVDRLLAHFARLHGGGGQGCEDSEASHSSPSAASRAGRGPPRGLSAEIAIDKLAAALAQAASAQAAAAPAQAWRRGGRGAAAALAPAPWWRQVAACWAHVLVGAAGDEAGEGTEGEEAVAAEALRVGCGLWRLGARCEVQPPDAGPLDVHAVLEAHQQFGGEAALAPAVPDFMVSLKRCAKTAEGSGLGQELPAAETGGFAKRVTGTVGARSGGGSRGNAAPLAAQGAGQAPGESPPSDSWGFVRFTVRALSEQGVELLERATKDAGVRDCLQFDERQRLLEFFERLSRRVPSRHLALGLPPPSEH